MNKDLIKEAVMIAVALAMIVGYWLWSGGTPSAFEPVLLYHDPAMTPVPTEK